LELTGLGAALDAADDDVAEDEDTQAVEQIRTPVSPATCTKVNIK